MNIDNEDTGKLILRVTVSVLILFHGIGKVMHYPASLGFIKGALAGIGLPEFIAYGVFLGEVIGPVLILIGLFCRVGGVLVVINMLFALGLAHMGQLFALNSHGAPALTTQYLFLFGALAIAFLGSGRIAVYRD